MGMQKYLRVGWSFPYFFNGREEQISSAASRSCTHWYQDPHTPLHPHWLGAEDQTGREFSLVHNHHLSLHQFQIYPSFPKFIYLYLSTYTWKYVEACRHGPQREPNSPGLGPYEPIHRNLFLNIIFIEKGSWMHISDDDLLWNLNNVPKTYFHTIKYSLHHYFYWLYNISYFS